MSNKSMIKELLEVNNKMRRELTVRLAEYDLSYQQWTVLKTIKLLEPKAMAKDICEITGIDKATMSDIVNRLIKREIVLSETNPEDKRGQYLSLSDEMKNLCLEVKKMEIKLTKEIFVGFTTEDKKEFEGYIKRINKNVEGLINV